MAHEEKLPWELIEEILSRVQPKSLVRFRTVSKQWNTLFNDKTFINNHKATFRFILTTKSKIYSVSIDPEIVVRELTLDIPSLESEIPKNLVNCNEFLLCGMDKGAAVWNPWLRQSTWIEPDLKQSSMRFAAIGYDNSRSYKILGSCYSYEDPTKILWKIYEFASDAWKVYDSGSGSEREKRDGILLIESSTSVSLNGTLYWVASNSTSDRLCLLRFDSWKDAFTIYCNLPCVKNHPHDAVVLGVFNGDRFSLLKQCHVTKKIETWVTRNKIKSWDGRNVEWMNFMDVSSPNLPDLVQTVSNSKPSYFIDDKRLVVCSCDEAGRAWIYVFGGNKLISKTQIHYVVDPWPSHYSYIPSLSLVPSVQK